MVGKIAATVGVFLILAGLILGFVPIFAGYAPIDTKVRCGSVLGSHNSNARDVDESVAAYSGLTSVTRFEDLCEARVSGRETWVWLAILGGGLAVVVGPFISWKARPAHHDLAPSDPGLPDRR